LSGTAGHRPNEHSPVADSRAEQICKLGTLTLQSERDGDMHAITLSGELDIAGAPELEAELLRAEAGDARTIMLDLAGLEFIDSTGLRVVLNAHVRSQADSGRLVLLRPTAHTLRAFEIAGLLQRLQFAD
jgi:anti-sigma B factor antagonist